MKYFVRWIAAASLAIGVLSCVSLTADAGGVVIRSRGFFRQQRVKIVQPAAIIAPQAVVVPHSIIQPQALIVPQQQIVVPVVPHRQQLLIVR